MTISTAGLVVCLALAAAGCAPRPPHGGAAAPPGPTDIAVGPIPGATSGGQTAGNPYAKNRTAIGEGRQLFVRFNCSGCHGGRAGGGMGPSLRDADWIYGDKDAQIYSSIVEGRANGMPSWHSQLTADQVWKIVTYIKALRTRNEPQAPSTQ